jgi:TPR repeat protein
MDVNSGGVLHQNERHDGLAAEVEAQALEDRGLALREKALGHPSTLLARRELAQAVKCFRRAAELGRTSAMVLWANALDEGEGVRRDFKQAERWNRRALAAGDPLAAFNLGVSNRNRGRHTQAVKWFRMAAVSGDLDADYQLALAAIYGSLSRARAKTAIGNLVKAASGHQRSSDIAAPCLMLAKVYLDGWLVPFDFEQAVRWLRRAADAGSSVATAQLKEIGASRLRKGRGSGSDDQ